MLKKKILVNKLKLIKIKSNSYIITPEQLKYKQSLSLEEKIDLSLAVIQEWYEYWDGKVYVSFSGGKDSTVLLDLVRSIYEDVQGVFCNTGLEYPEIIQFVNKTKDIIHIHPKYKFIDIIEKYGYPVISKGVSSRIPELDYAINTKNKNVILKILGNRGFNIPVKYRFLLKAPFKINDVCCSYLKKHPFKKFEKETKLHAIIGTMASESNLRKHYYLQNGCNTFNRKRPLSNPLSFWLEKDIWEYIEKYNINYSSIYDKGYHRTGCIFCMFGVHLEKNPNKFELMKETHPKQYKYCMENLGIRKVLNFINSGLKEKQQIKF